MFARSRNDPDDAEYGFDSGIDDVDPTPSRTTRAPRSDLGSGRERTIHFQPEDRYWTDYLRIALPVIGLVLMLGVFWYWAAAIIGDDGGDEPMATQPGQAQLNNPPVSSPTAAAGEQGGDNQAAGGLTAEDQTATAAAQEQQPANEQTPQEQSSGDNQAADQEAADAEAGEIAVDMQVEVTESVRLRPDPSTQNEEIALLDEGAILTVIGGPESGEEFDWWNVQTEDGEEGWVAEDFIQPVE